MRRIAHLLILAALSTGCAAQAAPAEIPPEFLGRWGENAEGCSPGAVHGALRIEATNVSEGEFGGEVKSVATMPDGSIEVAELWELPEEPPTEYTMSYSLAEDSRSLTVQVLKGGEDAPLEPFVLIRCETGDD